MVEKRRSLWRVVSMFAGVPLVGVLLLASGMLEQVWEANHPRIRAQEVPRAAAYPPTQFPTAAAAPGSPVTVRTYPVKRPVTETVIEQVTDPKTGKVQMRPVARTRMVTEYRSTASVSLAGRSEQEQELESQAAKLAAELRDATEPQQRDKLTEQLNQVLREAFALQQQRWAKQIEQLRSQLERLEQQRSERQEREDLIVQRRLSQLTSGVDPLAWEPVGPSAAELMLSQEVQSAYGAPAHRTAPVAPMQSLGAEPLAAPSLLRSRRSAPAARSADPAWKPAPSGPAPVPQWPSIADEGPVDARSGLVPLRPRADDDLDAPISSEPFTGFDLRSGKSTAGHTAPPDADVAESGDRLIQAIGAYLEAGEKLLEYRRLSGKGVIPKYELARAETAAEVARTRFELASGAFASLKDRLELQTQAAERKLAAAHEERELSLREPAKGKTSQREVAAAAQAVANAQMEATRAALALRGWQQAAAATAPMIERAKELSEQLAESEAEGASAAAGKTEETAAPTTETRSDSTK